jgi:hypothetical protein
MAEVLFIASPGGIITKLPGTTLLHEAIQTLSRIFSISPHQLMFHMPTAIAHVHERLSFSPQRLSRHPTYRAAMGSDATSAFLDRRLAHLLHCPLDQPLRDVIGLSAAWLIVSTRPLDMNRVPVEICTSTGKRLFIDLHPEDTILHVKEEISILEGIPPDQQRLLIHRGHPARGRCIDNLETVGSVLPSTGGMFFMMRRLRGGYGDTVALKRASSSTVCNRRPLPAVVFVGLWNQIDQGANMNEVKRWVEREAELSVELVVDVVYAGAGAPGNLRGQLWDVNIFWPMLMSFRRVVPSLPAAAEQHIASFLVTPPDQCLRGRPLTGATTIDYFGSDQDPTSTVQLSYTLQGQEHAALAALCTHGRMCLLRFSLNISTLRHSQDYAWHTVCTASPPVFPFVFDGGGFSFWNV